MRAEAITEIFSGSRGRMAKIYELADVYRDEIELDKIVPNPFQPRTDITPDRWDFIELVASIRNHGLLQPVVVTPSAEENGVFTLIAGERRWRAMKELFKEEVGNGRIAATVVKLKDPSVRNPEMLCKALTENVVRSNLETAELASAISTLREVSGWTLDTIADRMGISVKRVQDLSSIASSPEVLTAVRDGQITQKQAIVIAQGAQDPESALSLLSKAAGKDLRATARMVKAAKETTTPDQAKKPVMRVVTPPTEVDVDRLPIARLIGGGMTPREEIYTALDRTCLALGYWPEKPSK